MMVPATFQLAYVAAGRIGGFWQYSDVRSGLAAGALLVSEAGARALATKGHDVVVGDRQPKEKAAKWEGPSLRHTSLADAAGASPIVIHATAGDTALEMLTDLRKPLDGKVLLDVANATVRMPDGMPGNLCYPNSSLAEKLQAALPGTRVVKSLNTMLFTVMANPRSLSSPPTAFVSGNDEAAKVEVAALLGELGWPAEWIMDLGPVESARATEALILMVPHFLRKKGFAPFALTIVR
jgi:predicted dinucleotide-binding enzyme